MPQIEVDDRQTACRRCAEPRSQPTARAGTTCTPFSGENTARWDGTNGRYGVTWDVARDAMNRRAEADVAP